MRLVALMAEEPLEPGDRVRRGDRKGYQGYPKGDEFEENEPSQLGHHITVQEPNTCLCCGVVYYFATGPICICAQSGNYWLQDELRRVTCFFHAQEKIKDGIFGALPGGFEVPGGKPVDIKPREGRVAPIVHR